MADSVQSGLTPAQKAFTELLAPIGAGIGLFCLPFFNNLCPWKKVMSHNFFCSFMTFVVLLLWHWNDFRGFGDISGAIQ
jgi:hypothetical protein